MSPEVDAVCGEPLPVTLPTACEFPPDHPGQHGSHRIPEALSDVVAEIERRADELHTQRRAVAADREALRVALRRIDHLRGALIYAIGGVGFVGVALLLCLFDGLHT